MSLYYISSTFFDKFSLPRPQFTRWFINSEIYFIYSTMPIDYITQWVPNITHEFSHLCFVKIKFSAFHPQHTVMNLMFVKIWLFNRISNQFLLSKLLSIFFGTHKMKINFLLKIKMFVDSLQLNNKRFFLSNIWNETIYEVRTNEWLRYEYSETTIHLEFFGWIFCRFQFTK